MAKLNLNGFDEEVKSFQDRKPTASAEPASGPSKLESLLRGAGQGASLGFSDELTGLGESALGSLGVVPDKTYEQARDEARMANEAAQKANPLTYGTGEIGGTLATAIVPGAALGTGLKGAVATGALAGGLTGAGTSKSAVDSPEFTKEVALDALIGGGIPIAGKAIGAGAKALGSAALDTSLGRALTGGDTAQKMGKIFNKAKSGTNLQGKEVTAELNENLGDAASELVNFAKGKQLQASSLYENVLNPMKLENVRATQQGLEAFATQVERSPNAEALKGVANKLRDLSAGADMYSHQQIVDEFLMPMEQQLKAVYGPNVGAKKVEQIENIIYKNNPTLAKAKSDVAQNYAEMKTLLETMGVDPSLISSKAIKKENIALGNLTQNLRSASKPGTPNYDKIQVLRDLVKSDPKMLQNISKAEGIASDLELNKALREAPLTSGIGYTAANVAGIGTDLAGKAAAFVPEKALEAVRALRPKFGSGKLGQHVDEILANPDATKRNQAIFTLMQQPWFRAASSNNPAEK